MQTRLAGEGTPVEIRILGVNGVGHESANAQMYAGRSLPWLQDTVDQDVWTRWAVVYRDVVVLDEENVRLTSYNLTTHDLSNPAAFGELMGILREAAGEVAARR